MNLKINDEEFISHLKPEYFGFSLMLISKDGSSFCRMYWHNDDDTTIYLENLSVEEKERNKGLGNKTIKKCEEIALSLNFSKVMLTVDTNTWMYEWYKRLGYDNLYKYYQETDYLQFKWMCKTLTT